MSRFLVDTNVFIYARGGEHPYRGPCRDVLDAVRTGRVVLEASMEVAQEFAHVLIRRGVARSSALEEVGELRFLCHLHPFDDEVFDLAMDLLGRYPGLGVRDAVHAGTALRTGLEHIISTDRVFDEITEVKRVDPTDLSVSWG